MNSLKRYSALLFISLMVIIGGVAASRFRMNSAVEPIYPGPGVTRQTSLSEYLPSLKGTAGDSRVYVLEGKEPGATVLVLGGVHPPEISGVLTSVILIENAELEAGRLIVIPQSNASAFTYTPPGEGWPSQVEIKTSSGSIRRFRLGDRLTNPRDQWPDPDVYSHYPSGRLLAGSEVRNLNRSFPGRPDGLFTERVAYAITELVRRERVNLVIDLHEAPPQYPAVNVLVRHEKAGELVAGAVMDLKAFDGVSITAEPSPAALRGLSHRELGDHTDAYATLAETANVILWPLRGKSNSELVLTGKDDFVLKAARARKLYVKYDESGLPIELRVARHIATVTRLMEGLAYENEAWVVKISGLPTYDEVVGGYIGDWLRGE
ncbi:MAG: succinylglutamate desuccinylase/aspartoacylase family protein [Firmicutes bacterium]|nr:succinylglutamate desuccinylase/aspartoacylase family protein [Bacillota bacterium]